jgi:hypothetical protein
MTLEDIAETLRITDMQAGQAIQAALKVKAITVAHASFDGEVYYRVPNVADLEKYLPIWKNIYQKEKRNDNLYQSDPSCHPSA